MVQYTDLVNVLGTYNLDESLLSQVPSFLFAGKATISNDGATILKTLDIVHPAAKTLVDIAKSQDAEVYAQALFPLRHSCKSCVIEQNTVVAA